MNTETSSLAAAQVETSGLRWTNTALSHLPFLTQLLADEIISGKRAIESMLPAEQELCESHGLSRYAVREAMIRLQELGLIEKRRGIGTRVIADRPRDHNLYRLNTIADLVLFTSGTEFLISDRRIVTDNKDPQLFSWKLPDDHGWMRINGIRSVSGSQTVVSADTAYLHEEYSDVLAPGKRLDANLFVLLERNHGLEVRRIEQEVRAVVVPPSQAKILNVAPNSAGLVIARQFIYDRGVLIVTTSTHPAETFSYCTSYSVNDGPKQTGSKSKPPPTPGDE